MESLSFRPVSSGSNEKRMTFSQSEVQAVIQQEVQTALTNRESKLQSLVESIQQLDYEVSYKRSIRKLEDKINMLTERAEAAFSHLSKTDDKKTLSSHVEVGVIRSHSKDCPLDRESTDYTAEKGKCWKLMENTEEVLKKIHSEKEALTAAMADLSGDLSPPVLTPYFSFPCKRESEDELDKESKVYQRAGEVKLVPCAPMNSNCSKHTHSEQDLLQIPPLPPTTFPSTLNMAAVSYNIPQRVQVRLVLIRNPPGLAVLWNLEQEDPSAPPMKKYKIYINMEKVKGSGVFSDWEVFREVQADRLPMCVLISKFMPGHKLCVAVVGEDKFGRCAPYSEVVTAALPD